MHRLDVECGVRCDVPRGPDVRDEVAGLERYPAPVVDADKVGCSWGYLALVERGVALRHHRPGMCVRGSFAGKIAAIEFFERGVDVVEVERDVCGYLVVGVDLDKGEHFDTKRFVPRVAIRESGERETLPAGRHDGPRYVPHVLEGL